ncbi:MAG: DUF4139 domain-containing protein [Myxococcota bacterium]
MTPMILTLLAAVDAPVTQVTVFTNQARVVRTAQLTLTGSQALEFPPLKDSADVSSIRVEARGAEVERVDIERIAPEKLRTDEAKRVLGELDKVDQELERLSLERAALTAQREGLERLSPAVPEGDPLKAPPRLTSAGWAQGSQFQAEQLGRLQQRLREGERATKKLTEQRAKLLEEARKLGNPQTTAGWRVVAELRGSGAATVSLSYLVHQAQWTPTWDLQLQPDTNTVSLSLAALVSQASGEDWTNSALQLSTAIPSHAAQLPKLATWKIGVADRFIPTPTPLFSPVSPPPPERPLATVRSEEELVRARLQRLGIAPTTTPPGGLLDRRPVAFADEELEEEQVRPEAVELDRAETAGKRKKAEYAPAAPPPPAPAAMPRAQATSESVVSVSAGSFFAREEPAIPTSTFSLSPPPAWRPPRFGPDSPVTLADGYDLAFSSLQKESVPSGRGARRVALWSAQWPVTVERKLFPALTQDAYLVAELKNPSQQVLPGGPAQLFVGADPAGTARLKLVSPGEAFTLPLGIDRALKPVRNVQMVEETKGLISKDEIGTYRVSIELTNPYRTPISVRVFDQVPLTDQKELETRLVDSKPAAIQDAKKGALEWRATIAPQQKQVFSFTYTVKRPKGWKLQQQEVVR